MEAQIRLAAFRWLKEQTEHYGAALPRKLLEQGFAYQGQRVTLIGPSGIWKPHQFSQVPISISTTSNGPYDDSWSGYSLLKYRFRGSDPAHRDNAGLREAMVRQIPLIYFKSLLPGSYLAAWPVYIVAEDSHELAFTVAVDDVRVLGDTEQQAVAMRLSDGDIDARRQYQTVLTKQRLHQASFRERVLRAYHEQCAFCRLRHAQLLDAAHIIADNDPLGEPLVSNGLSLCKIHHAAFDADLIGVTPEFMIQVRADILLESDGPMLKHGIQALQNQPILLPVSRQQRPDRNLLEMRYNRFRSVG